jgi:hypothetical protein
MSALIMAALLAGAPAAAEPIPLSVWNHPSGTAEHLQSGLACPQDIGTGFQRVALTTYDGFGLDVSCGWNSRSAKITVYMTRGQSLAAAYAGAKQALVEHGQAAHPVGISDGGVQAGGLSWLRAEYREDGDVRSDIWMADLHGWVLLYRATYPAAETALVKSALDEVTTIVKASAGARLDLCAKTPPPVRKGRPAKGGGPAGAEGLMTAIVRAAADDNRAQGKAAPAEPIVYCVEAPLPDKDRNLLLWRGVTSTGDDAKVDRLTPMTVTAPPALQIEPDPGLSLIASELSPDARGERWVATLQDGERTLIFANFEGRPPEKLTADLMRRVLAGKARLVGSYNAGDKSISVTIPK